MAVRGGVQLGEASGTSMSTYLVQRGGWGIKISIRGFRIKPRVSDGLRGAGLEGRALLGAA